MDRRPVGIIGACQRESLGRIRQFREADRIGAVTRINGFITRANGNGIITCRNTVAKRDFNAAGGIGDVD